MDDFDIDTHDLIPDVFREHGMNRGERIQRNYVIIESLREFVTTLAVNTKRTVQGFDKEN